MTSRSSAARVCEFCLSLTERMIRRRGAGRGARCGWRRARRSPRSSSSSIEYPAARRRRLAAATISARAGSRCRHREADRHRLLAAEALGEQVGLQPSSATAASTRACMAGLTSGWPESTRDTDDIATPGAAARPRACSARRRRLLDAAPVGHGRTLGLRGARLSPTEEGDGTHLLHLRDLAGHGGRVQEAPRRDLARARGGDQGAGLGNYTLFRAGSRSSPTPSATPTSRRRSAKLGAYRGQPRAGRSGSRT